jgi:hypothetical protein
MCCLAFKVERVNCCIFSFAWVRPDPLRYCCPHSLMADNWVTCPVLGDRFVSFHFISFHLSSDIQRVLGPVYAKLRWGSSWCSPQHPKNKRTFPIHSSFVRCSPGTDRYWQEHIAKKKADTISCDMPTAKGASKSKHIIQSTDPVTVCCCLSTGSSLA